MEGLSQAQFAR